MHKKYLDKPTPIFAKNPQNEVFNFLQNTSGTNFIKSVSKEGFGALQFGIPQKCNLQMFSHNT